MAARKSTKTSRATRKPSGRGQPYSAPKRLTEEDVQAAVDIINKDYFQDVRGIGDELKEAFEKGEFRDQEAFDERLHQEVDGSQRVIYTFQSKLGMLATNHPDAYADEFGGPPVEGDSINWAAMMFASFRADILAYIGSDIDFDE